MTFKYVIFKVGKLVHPVIFSEHTTHSQIKFEKNAEGELATPRSAGFFTTDLGYTRVSVHEERSTSLDIGPADGDERWLSRAIAGGYGTAFFIEDESGNPLFP